MHTEAEMIDMAIMQLNKLQVTGISNCALVYEIYQILKAIKDSKKEAVTNGEVNNRGQGDPV